MRKEAAHHRQTDRAPPPGEHPLRALFDFPFDPTLAGRGTALIVAHADDETIGMGGHLAVLGGVTVVHVTDGAPRNLHDARRHGFSSWQDYAAARRRELEAAMGEAGILPHALHNLGLADQTAMLELQRLSTILYRTFLEGGLTAVFTHAYEGGHPDHDATCFAVHAAARLAAAETGQAPVIIEMPLYHAGPDGRMTTQVFPSLPAAADAEVVVRLDHETWARKRRMLDHYVSQRSVLAAFTSRDERFRRAPTYDFTKLPNGGKLLYEGFGWGIGAADWQRNAGEALVGLGFAP
jgi:LmbE family N-acetylglucosaminyl deacetylase